MFSKNLRSGSSEIPPPAHKKTILRHLLLKDQTVMGSPCCIPVLCRLCCLVKELKAAMPSAEPRKMKNHPPTPKIKYLEGAGGGGKQQSCGMGSSHQG